jgi:hypothetical protein
VAKIPEFMLKALYVRGSLQKTDDGFEFQLKNDLGPARIVGALPLQVDRKPTVASSTAARSRPLKL